MEMKYFNCLVMISLCLHGGSEGKKPSLRARLTALENLLNTQVYLIRDSIQSEIAQRDTLAQKVEETTETMERLQNELLLARTHKSDEIGPKYPKAEAKDLKKAITDNIVSEISEMLVRHRRGLQEEKIARKKDKEAIMNTLEAIMNTLQQMSKEVYTSVSEMKAGIISEVKAEINEVNDRTVRLEEKLLHELKNIHRDLLQSANVIETKTEAIKNISDAILVKSKNIEDQSQDTLSAQDLFPVCDTEVNDTSTNIGSCLKSHFNWIFGHLTPQVRIIGASRNEGRVELYYDGSFRPICYHFWFNTPAAIACRMLGYNNGTALYHPDTGRTPALIFNTGKGDALHVRCKGNERHLLDCYHYSTYYCKPEWHVGVRCS